MDEAKKKKKIKQKRKKFVFVYKSNYIEDAFGLIIGKMQLMQTTNINLNYNNSSNKTNSNKCIY